LLDANLKTLVDIKDAAEKANSTFGFEKLAADGSGVIYAIDRQNDEVCKFSPDGKFLNRFSSNAGSANAIAIDPRGLIFISETSEIKVLDANGVLQRSVDANQAFGIAFDQVGDLFVASRPFVIKYKLAF
jgi:hypothetical protein